MESDPFVRAFEGASAKRDGEVAVEIDIDIIRQMSLQLYTNPRKAIEELVSNSYDAGASECYVSTPHGATDHLVVLDNGSGMTLQGLKALWMVATSPKDRENPEGDTQFDRKMIGKFGVGKLAAFSLGRRIVHITMAKGITRIVSIGLADIAKRSNKGRGDEPFPVFSLPEREARPIVASALKELPRPWEQPSKKWSSWTAAIVHEIEPKHLTTRNKTLRPDLVRKMIGASMPITQSFRVWVDGEPVKVRSPDRKEKKLIKEIHLEDEIAIKAIRNRLRAYYKDQMGLRAEELVPPKLLEIKRISTASTTDVTKQISAIDIPNLGVVSGFARGYENTLTSATMEERGHADHGFSVKVRGKLVNSDDHTFGLARPLTYKYFNRFFAEIEVPSLDDDLLVQRNSVREDSERAELTRQVLLALFYAVRPIIEKRIEPSAEQEKGITWMQRASLQAPNRLRVAFAGLSEELVDADKVTFVAEPIGPGQPAASFQPERAAFVVNPEHPLLRAIEEEFPPACKKIILPVLHELLAAQLTLLGYLKSRGVDEPLIEDAKAFLDDLLVAVSSAVADEFSRHLRELDSTSYQGDKAFELAIVSAFESLGLTSRHRGGPGNPDGLLTINRGGQENLRVSVEAKGGVGENKDHAEIRISDINNHRVKLECHNAIVVARSFQEKGTAGQPESTLLVNSKAVTPPVVLLPLGALKRMIELHRDAGFSRPMVQEILTTWRRPTEMVALVEKVWKSLPASRAEIQQILEVANEMMADKNVDQASISALADRPALRNVLGERDLWRIMCSLSVLTRYVTILDEVRQTFAVHAEPKVVLRDLADRPRKP
jgi:hypothetical protein